MSYQALQFMEKNLIGHRFFEPANAEDLQQAWAEAKEALGLFRHSCAYICDFSLISESNPTWVDALSNGFLSWARQLHPASSCYLIWVGSLPILGEIRIWLHEQGLDIPGFENIESALSYINLKISSENIRQSMRHSETYTLDTDTRLELNAILKSVQKTEGDTTDNLGQEQEEEKLPSGLAADDDTQRIPLGGMFRLESPEMDKAVLVFPEKGGVLGRRDSKGQKPDVDLSLWSGFQSGVSRRHAEVRLHADGHLYLYDLDSTNGTFLNGVRLDSGRPYRIHNGDELRLGSLMMRVRFHEED